jgi:hypothetical protein
MKYSVTVCLILILQCTCIAQYKNNKWLLGCCSNYPLPWGGSKLEFVNNQRIVSYDPRSMDFRACFSGLSNKDDNWFVYTNGSAICNKDHDTLVNGFDLSPGGESWAYTGYPFPSQALFLPGDTSNEKHFLFHMNSTANSPNHPVGNQPHGLNLYYSIINPLAANGKGEVISKNNSIINDTLEVANIMAVRHANGRDWWVLVKRFYTDMFYSILVTPDSVYAPLSFPTDPTPPHVIGGQACFSPNGKYYASFSASSQLRLYDFDRCNGTLSNFRSKFITNQISGSTSFSPNSRYLYITSIDSLWQFDMEATDVMASQTFIAKYTDSLGLGSIFWFHWLAPDGKIYLASNQTSRKLHVINNPDMPGQACNFEQQAIDIPTYNSSTVPASINLSLYHLPGSPCDTMGVGLRPLQVADYKLQIFPNPSDGRFSVEYTPQRMSGMLYVYDVNGREVFREYVSPFTSVKNVDLSAVLTNGMYAVCLVFGNNRMMGKVIVNGK